jgi:hypothetical protein
MSEETLHLGTPKNHRGHIVGPVVARDAHLLDQYMAPGAHHALDIESPANVRPNPYNVVSNDPRNPIVYLNVPRQRTAVAKGSSLPGFKQHEIIERIVDPLGKDLLEL